MQSVEHLVIDGAGGVLRPRALLIREGRVSVLEEDGGWRAYREINDFWSGPTEWEIPIRGVAALQLTEGPCYPASAVTLLLCGQGRASHEPWARVIDTRSEMRLASYERGVWTYGFNAPEPQLTGESLLIGPGWLLAEPSLAALGPRSRLSALAVC